MSHFDQLIFFKEVGNWYLEVAEWTEQMPNKWFKQVKTTSVYAVYLNLRWHCVDGITDLLLLEKIRNQVALKQASNTSFSAA